MSCKHCRLKEHKDGVIRGVKHYELGYKGYYDCWIQPSQNSHGFEVIAQSGDAYGSFIAKYCPFCGSRIEVVK